MTQYYLLKIAYDGTSYHGWQIQPKDVTITSALLKAFKSVVGKEIKIIGASRTDAGVHAFGQVARIQVDLSERIDLNNLRQALNARLNGIHIRSFIKAPENFHPCVNVRQKTYWYILFQQPPLPMVSRFGWYYEFMPRVDLEKFKQCLALYRGTHDFGSFCKAEDGKTTIRTIDSITLKKINRFNAFLVEIKGPSFVRFQIRRMIGYALDVARNPSLSVDSLQALLDNPNPQQKFVKAEPHGLILRRIIYDHE